MDYPLPSRGGELPEVPEQQVEHALRNEPLPWNCLTLLQPVQAVDQVTKSFQTCHCDLEVPRDLLGSTQRVQPLPPEAVQDCSAVEEHGNCLQLVEAVDRGTKSFQTCDLKVPRDLLGSKQTQHSGVEPMPVDKHGNCCLSLPQAAEAVDQATPGP